MVCCDVFARVQTFFSGFSSFCRNDGEVTWQTYWDYLKASGGALFGIAVLLLASISQASKMLVDVWLSYWSDISNPEENLDPYNMNVLLGLMGAQIFLTLVRVFFSYRVLLD